MKNLILIAVLFMQSIICCNATAQEKHIYGNVFSETYGQTVDGDFGKIKVKVDKVKIFLVGNVGGDSPSKLKYETENSYFDFVISEKELKKYKALEFQAYTGSKIIDTDSIKDDTLIVILEETMIMKKPAIYLYTNILQDVTVKHTFKGKILNTYPKYNECWQVTASPGGLLTNKSDNRVYEYLFWDGSYAFGDEHYNYKSGFYVKSENTIEFLQSKLSYIGLNNKEINDFIVFWLPELNKNDENFIFFRINDNIDNSSLLDITPKPDSEIRVFMEFEQYRNQKKLPEQKLQKLHRKGFTVVEWGGAEVKTNVFE